MSDMMMNQDGQKAIDSLKKNSSMMNPVDIAAMKSPGNPLYIDPQKTTIREYFQQNGVDVDGPVIQLVKFAQDQATKASPVNKMQGIARDARQGTPVPPTRPMQGGGMGRQEQGQMPSGGGGLEALLQEMGG